MVSGEGNSCNDKMVAPREEPTLPTILSEYELDEIYNLNKFGFFYQVQPKECLQLKNEKCVSSKHRKLRLTRLATADTFEEKSLMFLIDKSKSSPYFKSTCLARITIRRKTRWTAYHSRNRFMKWINTLPQKDKKLFQWL